MSKLYQKISNTVFNDTGIGVRRLPYSILKPIVKFKTVTTKVRKYHGKIDEALNVMAINGSVLQAIANSHIQVDKYEHAISLVQTDFLVASKILLLSKMLESILIFKHPTKDTVAIYSSTLLCIIFASDMFLK